MFDPTIAFDKDYMVFVAPKPGLFPKYDGGHGSDHFRQS